ncbi:type II toxin-antitoxin system death-on-curing family toxin [Halostella litorea]|uniref:type II toxin-antitoxin system death-on-curing family toxin n=1 Tax=Halostella litorea TaxID=2528831 RepID=UPI0010933463|nr:type II toxin-antitoxin system death-on-curing family toxin [Halostella litorea]
MTEEPKSLSYLSAADIREIHRLIVESNTDTAAGISSPDDIEYTVEHIQEGHFGHVPESLHENALQLLRLIVANHPFVDENKRTALMSTRIFYALNGHRFDYDRRVKEILKAFATDEASVNEDDVIEYLQAHTEPLAPEYEATINLWLSRIDGTTQLSGTEEHEATDESSSNEPNGYEQDPHSGS